MGKPRGILSIKDLNSNRQSGTGKLTNVNSHCLSIIWKCNW